MYYLTPVFTEWYPMYPLVFLSGGYDSASVTTLLQKERTDKLKTFTISVPDIGLDEAPFAKELQTILRNKSCTKLNVRIKKPLN